MKRILLFACVAFAAITASAQKLVPQTGEKSLVFTKRPVLVNNIKVNPEMGKAKDMSAIAAKMQKAPATDSIYGNYIEDMIGDIHECSAATLSFATIDDSIQCVKFVLDNEVISLYGFYDEETGIINCGAQECAGGGDAEGYNFVVYGIEGDSTSLNLSFTIDDDKNIVCNQDGYIMYISDEGPYYGYTWDGAHFEPAYYPINGVQAGYTNGRSTSNQWVQFAYPVAIEDFEYSVNVYNYCGLGCLSIDINDDGTVSIPMGQPMMEIGLDEESAAIYGDYLCVFGVDLTEEGGIRSNTEKETTVGTIAGNTITITEYTRINSLFDEEGSGYAQNWYADDMTITLNTGDFKIAATGIEEVGTTLEERVKNTKTYNLMGQQVDRAATKGLLIRNGKKFISK